MASSHPIFHSSLSFYRGALVAVILAAEGEMQRRPSALGCEEAGVRVRWVGGDVPF